jgi:hypothetical protein
VNTFWIAFFALNVGIVAGFFAAAAFGVARINELHEKYRGEIQALKIRLSRYEE